MLVMLFSLPVIVLDEILKCFGRQFNHQVRYKYSLKEKIRNKQSGNGLLGYVISTSF